MRVDITESAESDLDRITDYIGDVLANPPAASALLDEITRISDALESTPEMFPLCADTRLEFLPTYVVREWFALPYQLIRPLF